MIINKKVKNYDELQKSEANSSSRAKLMQAQEIAEDKMEQNEDLAKLRAGVSLAKSGVQEAKLMVEDI